MDAGGPVAGAAISARGSSAAAREVATDSGGAFRIAGLPAGLYEVTVRRFGYREARLAAVRVADGQTVRVSVMLTQAARQLSSIEVLSSPTAIDAGTPALTMRIDREYSALLPSARDASSLIALVPGARKDQLWGGAPGVSNDYQIDGVSVSHPGLGGDFLSLSVDWIETLDIRGLGAGAEHGNFQGGVINAITRSGSNDKRSTLRTSLESSRITWSNFNKDEQGVEPAGRREVSGEMLGPLVRDRLFYFFAGQLVDREMRSPDLTTSDPHDFQRVRETQLNGRALGKVTWLPALGQRIDVLAGHATASIGHAGINGVDHPTATVRVRHPSTFYELAWTNAARARHLFSVKLAGFTSRESRLSYEGSRVPGVQLRQIGREPAFQNAPFDEVREPSTIGATAQWTSRLHTWGAAHQMVVGVDASRGRWRDRRTRNGGVTWRPYSFKVTGFDPLDARTWGAVGSDWGGEIRLDSDVGNEAAFVQDYITLGSRLTLAPGVRYGRWSGYIRPTCPPATPCYRFEAAHADAVDPRLGLAWDVTGRNTLAVKAHWGRYHQGMYALFFDRAAGANVHTNQRFYYTAPALTSGRQAILPAQRDAPGSGFSSFFDEIILDEAGRVENYRQPYVDQAVLAIEKAFGPAWKAEIAYTNRVNRDIVGLIDRNAATNYSPIYNTSVDHRLAFGRVLDANGNPLVLPVLYISNKDLVATLKSCREGPCLNPIAGYHASQIPNLKWEPDLVLTTIPDARRRYQQATVMLRTQQPQWRGEGSVTGARLRGNVPGVTGYGTTGTRFSAGPFVRPNEAINSDGFLPDAMEFEGKLWLAARLPWSLQGGVLFTHTLGERFAPTFEFNARYLYSDSLGVPLPSTLFPRILGQTMFVEQRGSRQYASRDVMDVRLEWRRGRRLTVTADLFNALGSNALTLINTNIGDQTASDPTSFFAAPRLRVPPRSLRLGVRLDHGGPQSCCLR